MPSNKKRVLLFACLSFAAGWSIPAFPGQFDKVPVVSHTSLEKIDSDYAEILVETTAELPAEFVIRLAFHQVGAGDDVWGYVKLSKSSDPKGKIWEGALKNLKPNTGYVCYAEILNKTDIASSGDIQKFKTPIQKQTA